MTRFFRRVYRREPISNFMLTVGTVDAVIGGVSERGSLLAVGLTIIGIAAVLRSWFAYRRPVPQPEAPPMRYLPSSSRPSLPMLELSEHD